jgi:hypothetical protein
VRVDAGDVLEHVGADAEAVERRLQPRLDLVGAQPVRRIDVGEAGDGDVLETWRAKGVNTKATAPPRCISGGIE